MRVLWVCGVYINQPPPLFYREMVPIKHLRYNIMKQFSSNYQAEEVKIANTNVSTVADADVASIIDKVRDPINGFSLKEGDVFDIIGSKYKRYEQLNADKTPKLHTKGESKGQPMVYYAAVLGVSVMRDGVQLPNKEIAVRSFLEIFPTGEVPFLVDDAQRTTAAKIISFLQKITGVTNVFNYVEGQTHKEFIDKIQATVSTMADTQKFRVVGAVSYKTKVVHDEGEFNLGHKHVCATIV